MTITSDGNIPHLEEEIGNVEFEFVDVFFLFVVVVVVIVAFNFLVVIVVVDVLVKLASLTVVPVGVVFLNVVAPLFSVEVVLKNVVVDPFFWRTFVGRTRCRQC